jgi:phosphate transport system permease protein
MATRDLPAPAKGDSLIYGTGAAVGATLLLLLTVVGVIMVNGLGHFWPSPLISATLRDGTTLLGDITGRHVKHEGTNLIVETQFNVRNRDIYGADFRWVPDADVASRSLPSDPFVVERLEYGGFCGMLKEVKAGELTLQSAGGPERLTEAMKKLSEEKARLQPLIDQRDKANQELGVIRAKTLKLTYRDAAGNADRLAVLAERKAGLEKIFQKAQEEQTAGLARLDKTIAVFTEAGGTTKEIPVAHIVRAYQPNAMGWFAKAGLYSSRLHELLFDDPREANTEGGIQPAIFGTVMMVLLMSLFCMPFGVIAAIYLREYAKEGPMVRVVRIAVNNLAGVPSIVYGIFGLGFFVYGVGGVLDEWFYPERLPTPTFGTGGILWASLTLALLTVPVVIVATEEALSSIPKGMREGSLALGATKWQTVKNVLLPMASPGILTGFILSMSRAAGEVAPLMITGVVKLAPSMPIDGTAPFVHLERKFMHLGFHIYDVGFQSPNVEAARPMVFVTTLVLLLLVILLNITAIVVRNRMRKRYTMGAF